MVVVKPFVYVSERLVTLLISRVCSYLVLYILFFNEPFKACLVAYRLVCLFKQ
jgi:hypothetical protein